jgi:hypothetical protein
VNILVVASLTRITTANYLVGALRRQGHSLLVISDIEAPVAEVAARGDPDVAKLSAERNFRPDLVLFIEGGTMQLFPRGMEKLRCPTAWYAIDTHTDYPKHAALARLFDVTFVAQRQYIRELLADGARSVNWLPFGFPSEQLPASALERDIDVAFVGAVNSPNYPDRSRALSALASVAGKSAFGPADPAAMFQRYSRAKVVFNSSVKGDLNMRFFEAMGAGAALLTDVSKENGADQLFEAGRHFVPYSDQHDLIAKFKDLLNDNERRTAIGRAAQEIVLECHTYDRRAAELIEQMRGVEKSVFPAPASYFAAFVALNMPVAALRAAADQFSGMGHGTKLSRFNRLIGALLRAMAAVSEGLIHGIRALAFRRESGHR